MEKGSSLISAMAIVKSVKNYVKLSDEEITKIMLGDAIGRETESLHTCDDRFGRMLGFPFFGFH